ncbi:MULTISPECIES: type III pantothenate kinase [Olsenella]|uniref:type III pantothenate kinase n=1 Tax=Olsenella TaxID=133925 RepID=UPI000231F2C5|nr:type III pantothenate kinase [Olsenella sp. oral taxon 809]EHF02758.1 hypothetical protein HMPREF1008_00403 [Olsenella sp. oral taxon 809 str. F0356]
MLLVVDVGNTQTTLGLFGPDDQLARQWRMASDKTDTADELHERLYGYFMMLGRSLSEVSDVAIASVVPILTQEWLYMMGHVLDARDVLLVDPRRDCGIEVDMPDPTQVGADRIANAVAAREAYGDSVIVVDFGTATNIDVVDARGRFRGGAIMPGLLLSAGALFSHAARLSSVPLVVPERALGNSTEAAVQSGIVIGAAAQAEGLVRRIKDELGEPDATVVGTGGLSREIAKATDLFDALDPDLTIRGIKLIWEHRARKRAVR